MNGRICKDLYNMKRLSYVMAFAMFLTLSCQKNESQEQIAPDDYNNYRTLMVGVEDNVGTRVGFDGNNSFYWHRHPSRSG